MHKEERRFLREIATAGAHPYGTVKAHQLEACVESAGESQAIPFTTLPYKVLSTSLPGSAYKRNLCSQKTLNPYVNNSNDNDESCTDVCSLSRQWEIVWKVTCDLDGEDGTGG